MLTPFQILVYPFGAVVFLFLFAAFSWPWQFYWSHVDKSKDTWPHSERIYKSFEFFVTLTLAIVGGMGFVRLEKFENQTLGRQALELLGGAALFVAFSFSLFVIIHQGSKLRRWRTVEWRKLIIWLELWMCIAMMGAGIFIWSFATWW